jgi:hypothetical protein
MSKRCLWAVVCALGLTGCIAGELGPWDEEEMTYETSSVKNVPEASRPGPGEVSFARATEEHRYGVPITDKRHAKPKVIYSVRLRKTTSDERLLLRGEVTLSRCGRKDIWGLSGDAKITPCNCVQLRNSPYTYNPRFHVAFVLAGAPNDADGKRVSSWFDRKCTEGRHHCAVAIPQVKLDSLPVAQERYVNLVVSADADGANARSFDVMEVEQHKGGLYVTRLGPGAPKPVLHKRSEELLAGGTMGIDQTEDEGDMTQVRRVLYRVKLTGLKKGDVVDADARMRAIISMHSAGCDPLITGELIVATGKGANKIGGDPEKRLTAKNGQNCTDHSSNGCKYTKSGAVRLGNGTPDTMYVKYIATAFRSCATPNGGDKWRLDPKEGYLEVRVRRDGSSPSVVPPEPLPVN